MYRFMVIRKGADTSNLMAYDIIDIQENLSMTEIDTRVNWFLENGYYQMADYKVEKM